jgi:hypothetical protein
MMKAVIADQVRRWTAILLASIFMITIFCKQQKGTILATCKRHYLNTLVNSPCVANQPVSLSAFQLVSRSAEMLKCFFGACVQWKDAVT